MKIKVFNKERGVVGMKIPTTNGVLVNGGKSRYRCIEVCKLQRCTQKAFKIYNVLRKRMFKKQVQKKQMYRDTTWKMQGKWKAVNISVGTRMSGAAARTGDLIKNGRK